MALIPNKSKTNGMADNGINLEVMMVLFVVILVGQRVFENKVHSWLSWVLILLLVIVGGYLIFPNHKNYGKIGYVRVSNYVKFMMNKLMLKWKLRR